MDDELTLKNIENGLYLKCDDNANIVEVLFDDLHLFKERQLPVTFLSLFDTGSISKAEMFWKKLIQREINYDTQLFIKQRGGKPLLMKFSGGVFNNQIWVLAATHNNVLEAMYDEMMQINNELQNLIRNAEKRLNKYSRGEQNSMGMFEEISRVNNDLVNAQRKLCKQNEQILRLNKELQNTNQELEHFAHTISHDLKEPLRMIASFMELLEKRYNDQLDDRARKYIYFATDGARRMNQMIHELLEYSRASRKNDAFGKANLNEIVQQVLKLNGSRIHNTGAQIHCGELPEIYCRKVPFQQLLNNLISNSLKYAKSGVSPEIEIAFKETETHWQFSVKDNGIGVEPQHHQRIFDVFRRVDESTEGQGYGMGLAICKKIVQDHGGNIWLESEKDKGSIFYFTINKTLSSALQTGKI